MIDATNLYGGMGMNSEEKALFKKDLTKFYEITRKFYRRELSVAEYKGLSGIFGSYAQRGGTASMLRLCMTGGEISG